MEPKLRMRACHALDPQVREPKREDQRSQETATDGRRKRWKCQFGGPDPSAAFLNSLEARRGETRISTANLRANSRQEGSLARPSGRCRCDRPDLNFESRCYISQHYAFDAGGRPHRLIQLARCDVEFLILSYCETAKRSGAYSKCCLGRFSEEKWSQTQT